MSDALARARAHAPFLRLLLDRLPGVSAALEGGDIDGALAFADAEGPAGESVAAGLRRQRRALALAVAVGDLAGLLALEEVVRRLSDFADRALDTAIATAIAERTPGELPRGFAALALGKHGSRELNYSSDIDPIFLFDPDTLPRRAREEPEDAAVRIGRRVIELLQSPADGGHVLRVDLRLRPAPEATPIAVPVQAAITYYESLALPWERAAFIRARAAAGDIELGRRVLDQLRPFVWRRALDFGALREVGAIAERIRAHYAEGQAVGPGYDIKRGRGGIREIEFFAQTHQLIHGGRDRTLRAPATLDALAALAAAGHIEADDAACLAAAYRSHRTIEHRLQMVEDRQTHRLPLAPDALANVAQLHGLADGEALVTLVARYAAPVGRLFDAILPESMTHLPEAREPLDEVLAAAGFPESARAALIVAGWRGGSLPATRSPAARAALEAMLPRLVAALGRGADPQAAIARFDDIVRRLPTALNLFRLIEARPLFGDMLADLLALAPALADDLGRQPMLIDGLIDASAFAPPPPLAELIRAFGRGEASEDHQAVLDRMRREVGERRFALGAQLVLGRRDPLEVGDGYGRVAEAALDVLGRATVAEFERAHGRVPDGELVVLALGRFGGGRLTHASDLDLVYLFTGDFAAQSDGARPLGATHYFNRLASRITAALSVPTAAGPMWQVDTRLRPSGGQGLLAVSFESFRRYHAESAWTWERMALTRARPVFGSPEARAEIAGIVADALRSSRPGGRMLRDAVAMRAEMARHKPGSDAPLEVKLAPGGLVDLEFAVQVRQLERGVGLVPRLGDALATLIAAGALPPELADAHRLLTRVLLSARLMAPDGAPPSDAVRAAVARACQHTDWPTLLAAIAAARQSVGAAWNAIEREAEEEE